MTTYKKNRARVNKFDSQFLILIQTLFKDKGCLSVAIADDLLDMRKNTDYVALMELGRTLHIAGRIRGYKYAADDEFTIRSSRPSGNDTELQKIKKGYGDYMLYCHKNKKGNGILKYLLIDLHLLREMIIHCPFFPKHDV